MFTVEGTLSFISVLCFSLLLSRGLETTCGGCRCRSCKACLNLACHFLKRLEKVSISIHHTRNLQLPLELPHTRKRGDFFMKPVYC